MSDVVVTAPSWLQFPVPVPDQRAVWQYDLTPGFARPTVVKGQRVYVVYREKLRGYGTLVRVEGWGSRFVLVCRVGWNAVTIPQVVRGFRGWKPRWWKHEDEQPFPDWRTP